MSLKERRSKSMVEMTENCPTLPSNETGGSRLLKRRASLPKSLTIDLCTTLITNDTGGFSAAYELMDEVLGSGSSAVVKRGSRKGSPGQVAVKIVHTNGDEEMRDQLKQEFQLISSLRHPVIVEVYDLFFTPNMSQAFLCMELVQGQTLRKLVRMVGKVLESVCQPLFQQLASALCYLHCKRITHRDLTPDNLLVTDLSQLKICDFNCAHSMVNGDALTPKVTTMYYAPPENLVGGLVMGEQADVWMAGVCLYFALSGGLTPKPETSESLSGPKDFGKYLTGATTSERQGWFRRAGLDVESSVSDLVLRCLTTDPVHRPSPQELMEHPWLTFEASGRRGPSTSEDIHASPKLKKDHPDSTRSKLASGPVDLSPRWVGG